MRGKSVREGRKSGALDKANRFLVNRLRGKAGARTRQNMGLPRPVVYCFQQDARQRGNRSNFSKPPSAWSILAFLCALSVLCGKRFCRWSWVWGWFFCCNLSPITCNLVSPLPGPYLYSKYFARREMNLSTSSRQPSARLRGSSPAFNCSNMWRLASSSVNFAPFQSLG